MSQAAQSRLGVVDEPGREADDGAHDRKERPAPQARPADGGSTSEERDDTDEQGRRDQDVVPEGQAGDEAEGEPTPTLPSPASGGGKILVPTCPSGGGEIRARPGKAAHQDQAEHLEQEQE